MLMDLEFEDHDAVLQGLEHLDASFTASQSVIGLKPRAATSYQTTG
jgi:hypothetical protein